MQSLAPANNRISSFGSHRVRDTATGNGHRYKSCYQSIQNPCFEDVDSLQKYLGSNLWTIPLYA